MSGKPERRKYPRVKDKGIEIKLSGEGFDAMTKSLDVSASGIYCKVKHRIPVMTKVQILLTLPGLSSMEIEGVVVREHPVIVDGRADCYDIAIFFNALMPRERDKLVKYINSKK